MLHRQLAAYLDAVDQVILNSKVTYVERYSEEILTPERVNLRIRIRFERGELLEINEAVIIVNDRLTHLGYRYHFQDRRNCLIFRYDNTPHFPDLLTFPHHKHCPGEVVASEQPHISQVLEEALEFLAQN
jgi:hypothetical protein